MVVAWGTQDGGEEADTPWIVRAAVRASGPHAVPHRARSSSAARASSGRPAGRRSLWRPTARRPSPGRASPARASRTSIRRASRRRARRGALRRAADAVAQRGVGDVAVDDQRHRARRRGDAARAGQQPDDRAGLRQPAARRRTRLRGARAVSAARARDAPAGGVQPGHPSARGRVGQRAGQGATQTAALRGAHRLTSARARQQPREVGVERRERLVDRQLDGRAERVPGEAVGERGRLHGIALGLDASPPPRRAAPRGAARRRSRRRAPGSRACRARSGAGCTPSAP